MKYVLVSIIWIFFLSFLSEFWYADSWDVVNGNAAIWMQSTWLAQVTEYTNADNTWELFSGSLTPIMFGDLQIEEVFPGSGNCLDEYIRIVSHREFSWYIDIVGAWVSSWIIQINVNLFSWEYLIVTDNIAGIKTTEQIILVPSITLTNGWELLQVWYSWLLLDDIVYSDPHAAKSLLFTEWFWWVRYFKTIINAQVQSSCSLKSSDIIHSPATWWCSITIKNSDYRWSGLYVLFLEIWSLSWCIDNALNGRYDWGGVVAVGACQTYVEVGPWTHHFHYYWYSESWSLICSDDLYFASQYDVWYIHVQDGSPWQCQNTQNNSRIDNSMVTTFYDSKDCGIELQSPKLWFTVDSALNVRLLLDGTWLNDSQKRYSCVIDFGNGEKIPECNPSSFHYKIAWMYTIWISIKDSSTGQPICTHTSFIYVPFGLMAKNLEWTNYTYISSWNAYISWSNPHCMWNYSGLYIYSLLPNPKGADLWQELITLSWAFNVNISNFSIHIGKKNFSLSWISIWNTFSLKDTLWLVNKWMCIDLIENGCGPIHHVCYNWVKENQLLYCSSDSNVLCVNQDVIIDINEIDNVSEDLSCTEKLNKLKENQKNTLTTLRNKQKSIIAQMRLKQNVLLQNYKDKERISRNSLYLQERWFSIIEKAIKNWEKDIWVFIYDMKLVLKFLTNHIKSHHYILSKGKSSKQYIYDIQKYIKTYIANDTLVSIVFPDLYMDSIDAILSLENK